MRSYLLLIAAFLPLLAITESKSLNVSATQKVKKFDYRTYGEIVNVLLDLEKKYPNYVEVYTAQDKYGLPSSNTLLCNRNGKKENCLNYILHITDKSTLPDPARPEVFFSGALHGNERVGPQTVVELAILLLDHVSRDDGSPWIKKLVQTRSIVIMPTTNPNGYDRDVRGENNIDPNRDFNYLKGSKCMETLTARSVNEVWRDHLFQLAITFHGGTEVIAYEWGSSNHAANSEGGSRSPDDLAQETLCKAMSRYGGAFEDNYFYPTGIDNDLVYPIEGGMEDWGYAASWENEFTPSNKPRVSQACEPKSYGGYSANKTIYNEATLRCFNILVETSNAKRPSVQSLGDDSLLSDANLAKFFDSSVVVGHVPRNIRLSLLLIDVVQPYLEWRNEKISSNEFKWEVLGSLTVDATYLEWSLDSKFEKATKTKVQSGKTRWSQANGIFQETVKFPTSGKYYVRAVARVDQNWKTQGTGKESPSPNVPPQSHVVNARTNPKWRKEYNGHLVQGKLDWYSEVKVVSV